MNPTGRRPAVLNRAVFTNRTFDSRALSVLTTLVHRFVEPGHYDVFVRRNGSVVHRTQVDVSPDHARTQVNVDMANVPESKRACGCHGDAAIELRAGGALVFYVSAGVGGYSVTITNRGARDEKSGLALDNTKGSARRWTVRAHAGAAGQLPDQRRLESRGTGGGAHAGSGKGLPPRPGHAHHSARGRLRSEVDRDLLGSERRDSV